MSARSDVGASTAPADGNLRCVPRGSNCGVKGAIQYRGVWLSPNSDGYKLYQERKWQALDAHLADVDRAEALRRVTPKESRITHIYISPELRAMYSDYKLRDTLRSTLRKL